MPRIVWIVVLAFLSGLSLGAQAQPQPQSQIPKELHWAFPIITGPLPPETHTEPRTLPGSTKKYTPKEIDDLSNPPDWYPEAHTPAPDIILKGHGAALACGSCHLMSGLGHPESTDLTGFTVGYLMQQMADFKSGARKDYARMNGIAPEVSDEESRQSAEWFASLKPRVWNKVVEADTVPKTFVGQGRMRFVDPAGGTEPIANRIITVPQDEARAKNRDPNSGFLSYVPMGSIGKGKALVETGGSGKTITCSICHGEGLKGLGNTPRLAGLHPIYLVRQFYLFKDGRRNGIDAQLMKRTVAQLTEEDIVNISAYLSSLEP